ncbi:MAG: redoxin domain-containing protein [Candidatus Eremiobacteraeota bacterium]|nr:redoxin domain-containing protein [Candidatus Eremiobacteraeota bacterium]
MFNALVFAVSLLPLLSAQQWLGAKPAPADLHGKVVIVDVFTFGCINCKHVVPELKSLYRNTSRKDLQIIGIHTPETPYERVRSNVVQNLALQGILWPVTLDNENALWNAYGIQYWPTQLIFDRQGNLRKTVIGEGQDADVMATVKSLIAKK